jgi:hypothetical protein
VSPPRRPIGALTVVLLSDISGVSTIAVVAVAAAVTAGGWAEAGTDVIHLVGCVAVGLVAWVLAVVAVARYRRGGSVRRSRRLIWIGLLLNTIGSLTLAITAGALGASEGLTVAVILAVAGAAVSFGYLTLLRERRPDR